MPEPSTSPAGIPDYSVDGIHRQDQETLVAIEGEVRQRREHLKAVEQREIEERCLAGSDGDSVEESEGGTVIIKKALCGKDCGGCPHGPYKYIVSREGGDLSWEYKGSVKQ